jgi:hypothetical protein
VKVVHFLFGVGVGGGGGRWGFGLWWDSGKELLNKMFCMVLSSCLCSASCSW